MADRSDPEPTTAIGNRMWGGRFAGGPDAIMAEINASIGFDRRLADQDVRGSKAHARMLAATGILTEEDVAAICRGLDAVADDIAAGRLALTAELEDIHMNVEAALAERIGEAAGRLHTARSRNDQVATDFRLWTRDAIDRAEAALADLQAALIDLAEPHAATVMPGFTHLQAAQPVTFGHHLAWPRPCRGCSARRPRAVFAEQRAGGSQRGVRSGRRRRLARNVVPSIDRRSRRAGSELCAPPSGFIDRRRANSLEQPWCDRDFAIDQYLRRCRSIHRDCTVIAAGGVRSLLWNVRAVRAFVPDSERQVHHPVFSSIMPQKRNPRDGRAGATASGAACSAT